MPEPSNYDTQQEWMAACVPIRKEEGDPQEQAVAACLNMWRNRGKAMDVDTVKAYGGELKALGDGKVGGYLVRFSGPDDPDLENDFFTAKTYYGRHKTTPVYYHHGQDGTLKLEELVAEAPMGQDKFGVWVQAQLDLQNQYETFLYERAMAGKAGWSSGTAPHLVEREPVGDAFWIKRWPLGLDASITLTPADSKNRVVTYKNYLKDLSQALGLWLADDSDSPEAEPEDGPPSVSAAEEEHRIYIVIPTRSNQ